MRSILWGVHLLGHAVKEVPTFVKSMPQPSDVMKRTVLMLHARNTFFERGIQDTCPSSTFRDCFSGYMSMFSVPESTLMQVQYLNDGGLVSFSSRSQTVYWRPSDCKICRASARCFPHSWEDAKGQVEPREEPICHIYTMTLESSSEQTRHHTV